MFQTVRDVCIGSASGRFITNANNMLAIRISWIWINVLSSLYTTT